MELFNIKSPNYYFLSGLRRSGNHLFASWIVSNYKKVLFVNDINRGEILDSKLHTDHFYSHIVYRENNNFTDTININLLSKNDDIHNIDCLIVSFEDKKLDNFFDVISYFNINNKSNVYKIIIIRDILNTIASRAEALKIEKQNIMKQKKNFNRLGVDKYFMNMWFENDRDIDCFHFNYNKFLLNYNNYHLNFGKMIGLKLPTKDVLDKTPQFFRGSSFNRNVNTRAKINDLLNRYKKYQNEDVIINLFNNKFLINRLASEYLLFPKIAFLFFDNFNNSSNFWNKYFINDYRYNLYYLDNINNIIKYTPNDNLNIILSFFNNALNDDLFNYFFILIDINDFPIKTFNQFYNFLNIDENIIFNNSIIKYNKQLIFHLNNYILSRNTLKYILQFNFKNILPSFNKNLINDFDKFYLTFFINNFPFRYFKIKDDLSNFSSDFNIIKSDNYFINISSNYNKSTFLKLIYNDFNNSFNNNLNYNFIENNVLFDLKRTYLIHNLISDIKLDFDKKKYNIDINIFIQIIQYIILDYSFNNSDIHYNDILIPLHFNYYNIIHFIYYKFNLNKLITLDNFINILNIEYRFTNLYNDLKSYLVSNEYINYKKNKLNIKLLKLNDSHYLFSQLNDNYKILFKTDRIKFSKNYSIMIYLRYSIFKNLNIFLVNDNINSYLNTSLNFNLLYPMYPLYDSNIKYISLFHDIEKNINSYHSIKNFIKTNNFNLIVYLFDELYSNIITNNLNLILYNDNILDIFIIIHSKLTPSFYELFKYSNFIKYKYTKNNVKLYDCLNDKFKYFDIDLLYISSKNNININNLKTHFNNIINLI